MAAAVTQEPMEEEVRVTTRRNAIRRTCCHMQTAQLLLTMPCATWSNSPTLHQLMCYLMAKLRIIEKTVFVASEKITELM
ncbi:hypothetical protein TNCV_2656451 [Trichonephila clavipes]|nr:hypothetical protein TNCV_2656451 [Trichonephila clavipes]